MYNKHLINTYYSSLYVPNYTQPIQISLTFRVKRLIKRGFRIVIDPVGFAETVFYRM